MLYDNELVTIVMPVYNNGDFAVRAIKSVEAQTYDHWELIIVDDCSSDTSLDMLLEVEGTNSKISVIASAINLGAGGARNVALEKGRGRYIAFLDADDYWYPEKLGKQLCFLNKESLGICHTSYSIIDEDDNILPGGVQASPLVNLKKYMLTTEIGMSTAVVDRNRTGYFLLDLIRTRQDTKLWLKLLASGNQSCGIAEVLASYRVRKGQISGNKLKMLKKTFDVFWTVEQLPAYKRCLYFVAYALSAVKKRM